MAARSSVKMTRLGCVGRRWAAAFNAVGYRNSSPSRPGRLASRLPASVG